MKRNNNLYKVTYHGKTYYFTKQNYITRLANLQPMQIHRCETDEEYAKKYDINIEIVDGSKILYEQINVL